MWFLQLSGWLVFLAIVVGVFVLMVLLSVLFTRLSARSVAQNAVLAASAVAVLAFLLLTITSLVTRAWLSGS